MTKKYKFSEKESKLICDLFAFADVNRITFHPIQDILKKVKTMASNGSKCICKPDERMCPCKESVLEIQETGKCFCMLFCRYDYGNEYLNRWGYIKDGKVNSDIERKKIVAEKQKKS